MPATKNPRGRQTLQRMGVCGLVAAGFASGDRLMSAKAAKMKLDVYKANNIIHKTSNGGVNTNEMREMLKFEGVSWRDVTKKYKKLRTIQKLVKAPCFFKGTDQRKFIVRSATHYLTVIARKTKKQVRIYDQRGKVETKDLKNYRIKEIWRITS